MRDEVTHVLELTEEEDEALTASVGPGIRFESSEEMRAYFKNKPPSLRVHIGRAVRAVREFLGNRLVSLRRFIRRVESRVEPGGYTPMVLHDCDTWNLDKRVSELIVFGTKSLRERLPMTKSHPGTMNSCKEWAAVLKDIERGFENHVISCSLPKDRRHIDVNEEARKEYDRAFGLLMQYYRGLWD